MTKKYFTGLNYTLGNEDTTVEIELVKRFKSQSVFSVCGSGGRALPLCGESVLDLTLSDLSNEQISLAKLREATYRQLSHQDFLAFWGYFPYSDDNFTHARKKLFLNLTLPKDVLDMFTKIYEQTKFSSVLYMGKWERTFAILAKINKVILGSDYDRILRFDNLDEQLKYYKNDFPHQKWKMVLFILGNKTMFNALLYKGHFIKKNVPDTHFDFYMKAFDRLFTQGIAQKSFFLQLCFYGKIKSLEGVPVEASLETHSRIQASKTNTHYITEDMISHLNSGSKTYDFLSLSDVPSYFSGDLERDFMQKIRPSLKKGAIVVNRYYLRKSNCDLTGFTDISSEFTALIKAEKVQMYDICIYRYDF